MKLDRISKMKKLCLFILFVTLKINAQVGYVSVENEVYQFLERMSVMKIIENYNSFEIPKTRKDISNYLITISKNQNILNNVDKEKLTDFINEFYFDITKSNEEISSLFPSFNLGYLVSNKEKFLYSYSDANNNSFFINFLSRFDYLIQNENDNNSNSFLYRFGGEVRGSLYDKFGFSSRVTNGSFVGNKALARNYNSLRYNYKFNTISGSDLGDNFFDETESFLMVDFDFLRFKFGNDRKLIGNGAHKLILSDNAPRMDYLELNISYKSLLFTYFHSKLLGSEFSYSDVKQGLIREIADKYLAYHKLSINLNPNFSFGLGETVIYANRNIDLAYINPFNFYKSSEHANQDRDNSMLFFDFQNTMINGLKFYSTILIDDIDFGKIGKGWYGNQSILSFGLYSSLLYNYLPIDFEFQYIKIDPYVFTHRINENNYTNQNFAIGTNLEPNSSTSILNFYFRPHYRISLSLGVSYSLHGANEIDNNGNLIKNFGGNINQGHRVEDSQEVYFLQGRKEILRDFHFNTTFEPLNNYFFYLDLNYFNNSLSNSEHLKTFFASLTLKLKI